MVVRKLKNIRGGFDFSHKSLILSGVLGEVYKNFGGIDLSIISSNKAFFFSKGSVRSFLNLLKLYERGLKIGYFVKLNLVGLGFRFIKIENYFLLKLGYSHYIKVLIPKDLHVFGFKRQFYIFGIDLQRVKDFSEFLRLLRRPDVYKGKGIQYSGEKLTFKEGKKK